MNPVLSSGEGRSGMGGVRGLPAADGTNDAEVADGMTERLAALERRAGLVDDLSKELDDTNRGLIALHTELEAARRAEARLAAIVASSDDALISVDPSLVVQTWNPGAQRLFGRAEHDVAGHTITALMSGAAFDTYRDAAERIRSQGHAQPYQSRWRRADGTDVDVAVTVSPMRDRDGTLIGFSTAVRDITQQLTAQAELAAARADHEVMADRERIARDLHDMVIQRIFGAGLALQSITVRPAGPDTTNRINKVIEELDATIRELRGAIFNLNQPLQKATSVRAQILEETAAAQERLGFAPAVDFIGPIDAVLSDETAVHVLAVVREALSNTARHARASAVWVTVRGGSDLVLEISDNGSGIDPAVNRSSGLTNLRRRAEGLGGTFDITDRPGGGTRLLWRCPITAENPGGVSD